MRTAEALRKTHAAALDGFLNHELFARIAEGRLDPAARNAYFVYEHRFVEQAVIVMGHILTKAPTAGARRHIVHILHGLVTDQISLFDKIFAVIGPQSQNMPQSVDDFCEGMTEIAREGSYEQGLAAMLAAEWTYAEVSKRLAKTNIQDILLRDWFDLHTRSDFLAGVAWLEAELDCAQERLISTPSASIYPAFLHAISLEIEFHNAPLMSG